MKRLFVAVLLSGSVAASSAANAAGGCGAGFHRGHHGRCVVNHGALVAAPAAPLYAERPLEVGPRPPCPFGYVWRYGACFPS